MADAHPFRQMAYKKNGGVSRIDKMEPATAAAAVVVVMIQRAGCILRGITRGRDIVTVARMIVQIAMLVAVRLM